MKRLLAVLLFTVSSLVCFPALADDPAPPATSITPEEAAKIRQQIEDLSKALGNPTPKSEPKTEDKTKTMEQVADKALDLFSGMIGTVSETLKKVAPEVWRIMIRQQYAKAATELLTPLLLLIGALITYFSLRAKVIPKSGDSYDMDGFKNCCRAIMIAAPIIFGIWLAINVSDSAGYLINPEYYALKDLLLIVTNPQQAP